jgi:hypothetical protein
MGVVLDLLAGLSTVDGDNLYPGYDADDARDVATV